MKTKALRYWHFKDHPFKDAVLDESSLTLFVNRKSELVDLEDALHNRITGIYGTLGIGKSTFLRQFALNPSSSTLPIILVHLPTDCADNIFCEILAAVLASLYQKQIKVKKSFSLDVHKELNRLEGTVAYSSLLDLGADFIIKITASSEQTILADKHDDSTARRLLRAIIINSYKPFVIVLDDFHNINIGNKSGDKNYFPLLNQLTYTIDQQFNHTNISFVVTLDKEFSRYISEAKRSKNGAFSFSMGDFIALETLKCEDLLELIKVRLDKYDWDGSVSDFMTLDAFYILSLCSDNHPRRALRLVRYAMQSAASEGSNNRTIDMNNMKIAATKADEELDNTDFSILTYLASHGPTSASDPNLQKVTGITLSPLRRRLDLLQERLHLITERIQVGKTTQVLYSIPDLPGFDS